MTCSAHVDTFARDRLPPPESMSELRFDLPELRYPERLNAASELLDRRVAEGGGARRCVLAPDGSWSYAELLRNVNRIARVLVEDLGIVPGNRVLLRAYNSPMLVACWLAVLKAGAVAVTTMPLYRAGELRHIIEKARVRHAICDERLASELQAALNDTDAAEHAHSNRERAPAFARDGAGRPQGVGDGCRVAFFGGDANDGLEALMAAKSGVFSPVDTAAEDVALIAFTSGTTGAAKATAHTHRDVMAVCDTFCARVLQPRADDLFAGSPPLGFTFGLGGLLLFPLRAGAATLLLESAAPEDLLRAVERHRITTLFTAPIAYRSMTAMADRYDLSSLRACVSAGEPLPKAVWEGWLATTGVRIVDGIGSTEMLHVFIASPAEETRAGSTGRVVPGYVAEVHDDAGVPLPAGRVGRLAVKGPTGCKYLDDDRQAEYVRNGWNYPGDAYRVDGDGYFWYVARTDDLIVTAGYNVSGPEVEQALLAHASVSECAVVAKPDPAHDTNVVKAFVVLAPDCAGDESTALALIEFCKSCIAPYKAPREIEFVAKLPRTETGKLQRYKLRER